MSARTEFNEKLTLKVLEEVIFSYRKYNKPKTIKVLVNFDDFRYVCHEFRGKYNAMSGFCEPLIIQGVPVLSSPEIKEKQLLIVEKLEEFWFNGN